jgi:Flp pilus assembly protein TadD
MDAYNKVLALDPDNPLVLNNLAMMTADSGSNLDQAMTYAQRAKKQKPDNANISDTLGYVYFKKDLNGEALRIFKQLSQANPQEPTFHFHLAMALAKSGDKQAARDEANKALQTTHSLDEKKKIESFVSQLG